MSHPTDSVAHAIAGALVPELVTLLAPAIALELRRLETEWNAPLSQAEATREARCRDQVVQIAVGLAPNHTGYLPSRILGKGHGALAGRLRREIRRRDLHNWLDRGGPAAAAAQTTDADAWPKEKQ